MNGSDEDGIVKQREAIPKFANEAEEAAFWSTHSLAHRLFTRRGPRPGSTAEKLSRQRFKPHATFSQGADAIYVYLTWGRSAKARVIDDFRLVDYARDGSLIGVRFLNVSRGVDLNGVPERDRVASLLNDLSLDLHVFA